MTIWQPKIGGGYVLPCDTVAADGAATAVMSNPERPIQAEANGTSNVSVQGPFFENQPGDYSLVTDHPCSSLTYDSWVSYGSNVSIVSEGTEPYSSSNSLQFLYPDGLSGGSYSGNQARYLSGYKHIYVGFFVKFSVGWQEHPGGTDSPKICFFLDDDPVGGGGGGDPLYIRRGSDGRIDGNIQNSDLPTPGAGQRSLTQNEGEVVTSPGSWAHVEVIAIMNTMGENYDGEFYMWVDGTLVCAYTDIWYSDSATPTWDRVNIHPIWGGLGGEILADQYWWCDHFRIAGKN